MKKIIVDGIEYDCTPIESEKKNEVEEKFNPYMAITEIKTEVLANYSLVEGGDINALNDETTRILRLFKYLEKANEFSMLNGGMDIDWEDENQKKWFISQETWQKEIRTEYYCTSKSLNVYFISEDIAQQFIDENRELCEKVFLARR